MRVREATPDDWAAIWPFMREIVAAGETYALDRDMPEADARAMWFTPPPDRVVVAVEDGRVVGTAKMGANRGGGGAHVATASYMVDPRRAGRGAGRALGEETIAWARDRGFRLIQFNAVVESNTRAVALWQSLGFEAMGTLPEGFRRPDGMFVGLHSMFRVL